MRRRRSRLRATTASLNDRAGGCSTSLETEFRRQAVVDSDASDSEASLDSAAADYVANVAAQETARSPSKVSMTRAVGAERVGESENQNQTEEVLEQFRVDLSMFRKVSYFGPIADILRGDDYDEHMEFPDDTSEKDSDDGHSTKIGRHISVDSEGHDSDVEAHSQDTSDSEDRNDYALYEKDRAEAEAVIESMLNFIMSSRKVKYQPILKLPVTTTRCSLVVFTVADITGCSVEFAQQDQSLEMHVSLSNVPRRQDATNILRDEIDASIEELFADRYPGDWSCGAIEGVVRARCEQLLDHLTQKTRSTDAIELTFPKKRVQFILERIASILGIKSTSGVLFGTDEQSGKVTMTGGVMHGMTRPEMAKIAEFVVQTQCWTRVDRSSGAKQQSRDRRGVPGELGSEESLTRSVAHLVLELYDHADLNETCTKTVPIYKLDRRGQIALERIAGILGFECILDEQERMTVRKTGRPPSPRPPLSTLKPFVEEALRLVFPPNRDTRLHVANSKRDPQGKGVDRLATRFRSLAIHIVDFFSINPTRKQHLKTPNCKKEVCRALVKVARAANYEAQIEGKGRKSHVIIRGSNNVNKTICRVELERIVRTVEVDVFGERKAPGANQQRKAQKDKNRDRKVSHKKGGAKSSQAAMSSDALPTISTARGRETLARNVHRAEPIDASNRGHQLLSKLGWKNGDGLGADRSGRKDLVQPSFNAGRRGLG